MDLGALFSSGKSLEQNQPSVASIWIVVLGNEEAGRVSFSGCRGERAGDHELAGKVDFASLVSSPVFQVDRSIENSSFSH